ncbi:MAG: alanine dehydrogenase [Pirellulales bacterium]
MKIGVPKETKRDEYRVAMLPVGVEELVRAGHSVFLEKNAGLGSGLVDDVYARCGAILVDTAEELFSTADLIVKVKEPQPAELNLIRPSQIVFTYFHFAASRELTNGFLATGATAVAYETLRDKNGKLPLLIPMSEVAGRMSIQEGAKYLEKPQMGRGILLGGVPGVAPANVLVLGAGTVGANAAKVAAGFGANIALLDTNLSRLRYLDDVTPPNIDCLYSDRHTIRDRLSWADLVVGSVLIPGARAPHLVESGDLHLMKSGAVIIDVAIDQGGCIATSRPTSHAEPTFVVDDVVHYCVTNMPGAVGRTSTYALCNATLPYVLTLAQAGSVEKASHCDSMIRSAVNILNGKIVCKAVADAFGEKYE